jgi:hypothetical protein
MMRHYLNLDFNPERIESGWKGATLRANGAVSQASSRRHRRA